MASVNKAIILGHCGRDPETRFMPDGTALTSVSIATSYKWKDKQTGESKEDTEWHRVEFRARLAEVAAAYLKKGSPVYIEGRIRTRKWTDKSGVEKYVTEIMADSMQLLGGKDAAPQEEEAPQAPARATPTPKPASPPKPAGGVMDMEDDLIPF